MLLHKTVPLKSKEIFENLLEIFRHFPCVSDGGSADTSGEKEIFCTLMKLDGCGRWRIFEYFSTAGKLRNKISSKKKVKNPK